MHDADITTDGSIRHPLEVLADEFSEALRAGSNPSIELFADRVPNMREQAIALLQSIVMFEQVSQQEDSRHRIDRTSQRFAQRRLETLGDFKIIREIGRGGMGIIYEAEQLSLKRRVALKVLGPGIADSQKQLDRFRRESEAIARLHHTNIVPVFGVGTEEGVHYFAMQLIDGKPLSSPPELSFHDVAKIGTQAASALAYAHEHGVLHRDIKPSNLLLDANGELWVTDFGLAKLTDSNELTQDGDIMGTIKYMAPEQLDGRSDARSDIYALGLTLYELATRQPAFDASKSLVDRIRQHEIPKPRSINPAIPRNLETIILKATSREASARYATAEALNDDLRRFLEDRPIAARRESIPERLGRWMRRNPAIASSLAVTMLVLIATSSILGLGYWTTQNALTEAKLAGKVALRARDEAERSRSHAESNLSVATAAFDAIFENVSKRGVPQSITLHVNQLADSDASAPIEASQLFSTLTGADVELLNSLLSFYREFAKQNSEDASLQFRIARAYQRSGQIQLRLGRTDEAIASYDEALKLLAEQLKTKPNEPFNSLAIAQILNDRGLAFFASTEIVPEVVQHHHRACSILNSLPESVHSMPEIRFEIARSLDLAGSVLARHGVTNVEFNLNERLGGLSDRQQGPRRFERPPMFGGRRPGPPHEDPNRHSANHAEHAGPPPFDIRPEHQLPTEIDAIFADLKPPTPGSPFPGGMKFDGIRTPPHDNPNGDRRGPGGPNFADVAKIVEQELNAAAQLLAELCSEFPANEDYQLASAQVNRHRMQLYLFAQRAAESEQAFNAAREALVTLVDQHPQNPQYLLELADTLSYVSTKKMQSISASDEEQFLKQAIEIGEQLCEAFPTVPEYQALLASTRDKFGALAHRSNRLQEAELNLRAATDGIRNLQNRFPDNRFYQLTNVLTINNLAKLYLDPNFELGESDKLVKCRDELQSAITSLTADDKFHDPLADRSLANSRETLKRLNQQLLKN